MPKGVPGSKPPHGNYGRYSNHRCRCDACREAWRVYVAESEWRTAYRRRQGERPRAVYLAAIEPEHGTESRYTRCKCAECREAARVGRARRRAAQHG